MNTTKIFQTKQINRINRMIERVCLTFNVTKEDLMAYKYQEEYRFPRSIVYYILLHEYKYAPATCTRFMNRNAHHTLLSGAKKIAGFIDNGR